MLCSEFAMRFVPAVLSNSSSLQECRVWMLQCVAGILGQYHISFWFGSRWGMYVFVVEVRICMNAANVPMYKIYGNILNTICDTM